MHCITCTIGIRCHVSANGSVVPPMVLRYWHDRRVGKGTNQHGNGFALATSIAVVLLRSTSTCSHPTFGFATARPPLNAECCVGPAPCAFGNGVTVATSSLRCAHWSAASVLAIVYRHCFATDTARLPWSDAGHAEPNSEPLYDSLLYPSYFSFPPRLRIRSVHTRPRSRSLDKPLGVLGVYTTYIRLWMPPGYMNHAIIGTAVKECSYTPHPWSKHAL